MPPADSWPEHHHLPPPDARAGGNASPPGRVHRARRCRRPGTPRPGGRVDRALTDRCAKSPSHDPPPDPHAAALCRADARALRADRPRPSSARRAGGAAAARPRRRRPPMHRAADVCRGGHRRGGCGWHRDTAKSARRALGSSPTRIHLAAVIARHRRARRQPGWNASSAGRPAQQQQQHREPPERPQRPQAAWQLRLGAHRPVQRLAGAARGAVEAAAGAGAGLRPGARCGSRSMPSARSTRCRAGSRAWMQCRRPSALVLYFQAGVRLEAQVRGAPSARTAARPAAGEAGAVLSQRCARCSRGAGAEGGAGRQQRRGRVPRRCRRSSQALDAALAAEPAGSAWMLMAARRRPRSLAALPQPGPRCSSRGARPAR